MTWLRTWWDALWRKRLPPEPERPINQPLRDFVQQQKDDLNGRLAAVEAEYEVMRQRGESH